MKINQFQSSFTLPYLKVEQPTKKAELVIISDNEKVDSKQRLKDMAKELVAEFEKEKTNDGRDDPKAQDLIRKFKGGKKLTNEEMSYLRKHAPALMSTIDRVAREREATERRMRMAPTKADVQMVVYREVKQMERDPDKEYRTMYASQLRDAQYKYEKTDEYKEKPMDSSEAKEKKLSYKIKKQKDAYEKTMDTFEKDKIIQETKWENNIHIKLSQ